jgi:hypothetical protein
MGTAPAASSSADLLGSSDRPADLQSPGYIFPDGGLFHNWVCTAAEYRIGEVEQQTG